MSADAALLVQAVVFTGTLVGAAIYDVRTRLVDDRVCILLALAGLISVSPASLLGAMAAALPFYIGAGLGYNGAGDIYLSAAAGFVLGFPRTLAGLSAFCVLYALFVLAITFVARAREEPPPDSCPLVPFLAMAFITAYFFA